MIVLFHNVRSPLVGGKKPSFERWITSMLNFPAVQLCDWYGLCSW